MSDSSDKQLTVRDCGLLLPPNLHVGTTHRYWAETVIVNGCKLCRTTCSVNEDKLCPPSLSKSSFARSNSSVGTPKRFLDRGLGRGCAPPQKIFELLRLKLSGLLHFCALVSAVLLCSKNPLKSIKLSKAIKCHWDCSVKLFRLTIVMFWNDWYGITWRHFVTDWRVWWDIKTFFAWTDWETDIGKNFMVE